MRHLVLPLLAFASPVALTIVLAASSPAPAPTDRLEDRRSTDRPRSPHVPVANSATGHVLRAAGDFRPVAEPAFAPSYAEIRDTNTSLHGLAVNPKIAQDRFAAAEATFGGDAGLYTVRLHAIAEEDGESVYELVVDGQSLGRRTNPRVTEKRVPVAHAWPDVRLAPAMRLRVLFAGRSNGLYPEGEAFAWSRGRWRSVELVR